MADSDLLVSDFTGNSNKYFSDTVEWWDPATLKYDMIYYDPDVSQWKDWVTESQTSRTFKMGEGFWIIRLPYRDPYIWTAPILYEYSPSNFRLNNR